MSAAPTVELRPAGCPGEDVVVAFIERRLDAEQQAELESHIDRCAMCRQLVSAIAYDKDGAPDGELLTPGQRSGRYTVLELVGRGGMANVYAAYDPNLDRRVALKVVRDRRDGGDPKVAQTRLVREAQAIARLAHPNVISVYDAGIENGRLFVGLEYIDGGTLTEWLDSPRTPEEILRVFLEAGRGLAAAHRAGLVHRDFKPSNVLMGSDGRVLVADFGLVLLENAGADNKRLAGTPRYMAPEQLMGEPVDARVDQFSFCVALYEALYGQRPFEGNDVFELRRTVSKGELKPPPQAAGVPPTVRSALTRGLQRIPSDRFASMDELLADLLPESPSPVRRTLASVVFAVVVTAIAGYFVFGARGEPPPDIDALVAQAREAAAQRRYLFPPEGDVDAQTAFRAVAQLEQLEQDAADNLRKEFAAELVQLGDMYWDVDGGRPYALDFYIGALVFDRENVHARARAGTTPGELADLRARARGGAFEPGELHAGERLATLAHAGEDGRSKAVATAQKRRRDTLTDGRKPGTPHRKAAHAPSHPAPPAATATPTVRQDGKAAGSNKQVLAEARKSLRVGDLAGAEKLFRRALDRDARSAAAHIGLGEVAFERGRWDQAARSAGRAVQLAPRRSQYRVVLGDAYRKLHRYGDARKQYEKAKSLGSKVAGRRLASLQALIGENG